MYGGYSIFRYSIECGTHNPLPESFLCGLDGRLTMRKIAIIFLNGAVGVCVGRLVLYLLLFVYFFSFLPSVSDLVQAKILYTKDNALQYRLRKWNYVLTDLPRMCC